MGIPRFGQVFAALVALSVLSGCGTTGIANDAARDRWIGQPSDAFFVKHGAPKRQLTLNNGGKVYAWETVAMPSGTQIQIACSADIVTDPRGIITEIRLQEDTIGLWNTSRCTEVFAK